MLPVSRAVVGAGHVTACVVLGVVFVSTGAWLPLLLSCTAGCFAWWLLRDDAPPVCPADGGQHVVNPIHRYDTWCAKCDQRLD